MSDSDPETNKKSTYILYALLIACVIYLVYYIYNHFMDNSACEDFVKGNEQVRDDPSGENSNNIAEGFDLKQKISKIYETQRGIIEGLSDLV